MWTAARTILRVCADDRTIRAPRTWALVDVMLARRKMRSKELAERMGISEQNVSLLKSGKVKGVRFDTLARICDVLDCQPGDVLEYRLDLAESVTPVRR